MNYLDDWARANLSPEHQQKFFAEQEQLIQDLEKIECWCERPEEAMNLTTGQVQFLREHNITVSTAYIGMVRFYIENRTIFQTSAMDSIATALFARDKPGSQSCINYDGLIKQIHEYLNLLMSANPEIQENLLLNHMPLFGNGELDQVRQMCGV